MSTIGLFLQNSPLLKTETRELLKHVLKVPYTYIISHPESGINDEEERTLVNLIQKRQNGIPIAYIIEKRDFYKHSFYTPQGVLIPQPDTETLVEEAIKIGKSLLFARKETLFSDNTISILDLCSGSGCIGISVAAELSKYFQNTELTLSDIDKTANIVSQKNAETILKNVKNVRFSVINSNLFSNITDKYNLILTNPPYIKTAEIPFLSTDVQAEPHIALDGGEDGFYLIRQIIHDAKNYLHTNSYILMEIGCTQAKETEKLFKQNFFGQIKILKDLAGKDRVLEACLQ